MKFTTGRKLHTFDFSLFFSLSFFALQVHKFSFFIETFKMSAIAALALREAIIPLQQSFNPEELTTAKVENTWDATVAGTARERSAKMYLPIVDDPSKKELFFYVIDQFYDAMSNDRLHITTGERAYSKFRCVLQGSLRLTWQDISANQANKTMASFHIDVKNFIDEFFASTSRDDQLEYMRNAFKPYNMGVEALAARIRVISRLGRFLPGSVTVDETANPPTCTRSNLYNTDTEYKRLLFSMVPMSWRIKFAETTHQLDDNNYKYSQLVQYLALQEAIEKNARGKKRAHEGSSSGGGRGRGRGSGRGRGRNGGRGSYGRGYSSGGRGSYGRGYGYGAPHGPTYYAQGTYQTSNNRFLAAARGGRFAPASPRHTSPNPGRAGFASPGRGGGYAARQVTNSPRRPMVQGRGAPPQFPQFMADQYHQDHYYQAAPSLDQSGHEQYYSHDNNEMYHSSDGYDYSGEQEMYHYQDNNTYSEDHYYSTGDDGNEQYYGEESQEQERYEEEAGDAHFLQDFGY